MNENDLKYSMKKDSESAKYTFVDALRGIAILLVLIAHNYLGFTQEQANYPTWFGPIIYQGVYGVQLFYMMSAFTLFLSLSYQEKKSSFNYRNFFIRRYFRVAPMFYLAIFYFVCQNYLQDKYLSSYQIISTITFLHGFFPEWINGIFPGSWSIAIEMPFYLLVPFLFNRIKSLNHALLFFNLTVIFSKALQTIIKYVMADAYPQLGEFLYFYLPAQLPVFALGIILYFLFTKQALTVRPITLLLSGFVLISHYVLGGTGIISHYVLLSIGFLVFIYTLTVTPFKLFVNPFTVFVGKVSYGIYLLHWAVFDVISGFKLSFLTPYPLLNFALRQVIIIVLCTALAYALHLLVEKPFQRFGQKISKHPRIVQRNYAYQTR